MNKNERITYQELRDFMLQYKEELAKDIERNIVLDSYATLIVKAINDGNKKDLDFYLGSMTKFCEEVDEE